MRWYRPRRPARRPGEPQVRYASGMSGTGRFASRLISASAAGYAAAAANRLLEEHPETAARYGAAAFANWQQHLKLRLGELAAALLAEDAELLTAQVSWSAASFRAREVPAIDLRASLECLRETLAEELPEEAAELPLRYVEAALDALDAGDDPSPAEESRSEATDVALAYLEAALSGDRRRAIDSVLSARAGGVALDVVLGALMIAQQRVGAMWHAHQVGVAQEHFVTETTRAAMAILVHGADVEAPNGKTVVVASAPGNPHDMGARLVAALFEIDGWRTVHVSEQTPGGDIVLGLAAFDADLLALSMTLPTQLEATMSLVERVRADHPEVKILLGGHAVIRHPQLAETIGADASGTTAADASRLGRRLVGLDPPGS